MMNIKNKKKTEDKKIEKKNGYIANVPFQRSTDGREDISTTLKTESTHSIREEELLPINKIEILPTLFNPHQNDLVQINDPDQGAIKLQNEANNSLTKQDSLIKFKEDEQETIAEEDPFINLNDEELEALKSGMSKMFKQGIEERDKEIEEERKLGHNANDLSTLFKHGIDEELTDLINATDEQKILFKTALIFYMQERISLHVSDVIPKAFFEDLDEMLKEGEIQAEEIVAVTMVAYEAAMEQSIGVYATNLLIDILPQFKQLFNQQQADISKILALSPEQQQKFIDLIAKEKYDEADQLIAGK